MRFRLPSGLERYVIDKGSITLDGISLTVVEPTGNEFEVWVIPHTLANPNLGERQAGDRMNRGIRRTRPVCGATPLP